MPRTTKFAWIALFTSISCFAQGPSFQGDWLSNCYAYPARHSFIAYLDVTETDLDLTVRQFEDRKCVIPSLTVEITGAYSLGDSSGPGFEIDILPKSFVLTLVDRNSDLASVYDKASACGYSDWTLNVPKDITNRDCTAVKISTNTTTPFTDIYGVANGFLKFGSFPLPSSGLPSTLNPAIAFTRAR